MLFILPQSSWSRVQTYNVTSFRSMSNTKPARSYLIQQCHTSETVSKHSHSHVSDMVTNQKKLTKVKHNKLTNKVAFDPLLGRMPKSSKGHPKQAFLNTF